MTEKRTLDTLVVDVEDSATLLKLYIGRLLKSPGRVGFYHPLVEHSEEIVKAVEAVDFGCPGRNELLLISRGMADLAATLEASHAQTHQPAPTDGVLRLQQLIDSLEDQLYHLLQGGTGLLPDADTALAQTGLDTAQAHEVPIVPHEEAPFDDDPFDELSLSDEFLSEILDNLDALDEGVLVTDSAARANPPAFDVPSIQPGAVELSDSEKEGLRELFAGIAQSYVGPITGFVAKLRVGPVSTTWIDLVRPAVQSVQRASASMGYENLGEALGRFDQTVEEARSAGRIIDGDRRAAILEAYSEMTPLLPSAFPEVHPDHAAESGAIILNSLLKQIKGVGRITISRLFAAGLVSLESYYIAEPADLAAAAGLKFALAERICDRFRTYHEVSELSEDRDLVQRRLLDLVGDLKTAQFEFKRATLDEWYTRQPSREKAKARRARQQVMWKVNVALAELGALDLLREVKGLVYDRRIERLEEYLSMTQKAAGG